MARIFHFFAGQGKEFLRPPELGWQWFQKQRPRMIKRMWAPERAQLMRTEKAGSQIEARDCFASCSLGVNWYKYEDFKELEDLRRSTTVVGYLPIYLVVLVAIDAAEMTGGLRGKKEGVNYG